VIAVAPHSTTGPSPRLGAPSRLERDDSPARVEYLVPQAAACGLGQLRIFVIPDTPLCSHPDQLLSNHAADGFDWGADRKKWPFQWLLTAF
jgi:hypothetical protein